MTKELQDLAWSCLPKEFKEEVKKEYRKGYVCETLTMLITLFGHHNLTSDAEEEEILTVSRNNVMAYYRDAQEDEEEFHPAVENACNIMYQRAVGRRQILKHLFGSKCLPDNVDSLSQNPTENCDNESHISTDCDKPAEPKFKKGDKVRYRPSGEVYEVEGKTGRQHYALKGWLTDIVESDLKPYTEPTDFGGEVNFPTKNNLAIYLKKSKNCDNRLQIAAMAMQGILSNIDLFKNVLETGTETLSGDGISYRAVAKVSLLFADALIAESEKRSEHGK